MSILVFIFSLNVWSYVQSESDSTFSAQLARAENAALPMGQRWEALIKSAELADGLEIKKVLAFSKSKDWYMRNALLVALDKSGTDLVYDHAKSLVSDKALVVRSAAVEILNRLESQEVRELLSKELNKNYNFSGKKSLWIRPQIMKNLIKNPTPAERDYFAKLLFDQDAEISEMSISALEKITQVKFEGNSKLEQWKKLAKDKKWF